MPTATDGQLSYGCPCVRTVFRQLDPMGLLSSLSRHNCHDREQTCGSVCVFIIVIWPKLLEETQGTTFALSRGAGAKKQSIADRASYFLAPVQNQSR